MWGEQGGLRPTEAGSGWRGSWRVRQGSGGSSRGAGEKSTEPEGRRHWNEVQVGAREQVAPVLVGPEEGRKALGWRSVGTGIPEVADLGRSTCEWDRLSEGGGARV